MAQDTRKDPRAKVLSMTVRYKSATVDEFIEHHSHDVSRGGIFIKTPSPFPPGTLLKFEIRIQDEQSVLAGVGRVVWKRDAGESENESPAGMGVKFIKIDDKSKGLIQRLVESQPEGTASAFEAGKNGDGTGVSGEDVSSDESTKKIETPAPAASGAAKPAQRRASTMLGLGSIGGAAKGEGASDAAKDEGGGGFFPRTNPDKEMPPAEERTVMKQAAELLKQALAEAGGSLDDLKDLSASPAKEEPKPVVAKEEPKPVAAVVAKDEPIAVEPATVKEDVKVEPAMQPVAKSDDGKKDVLALDEGKLEAAVVKATSKDKGDEPAPKTKAAKKDDAPKTKPSEKTKPAAEERAVVAKPTPKPLMQEPEESGGSGKILTILLVVAGLGAAAWLLFGRGDNTAPTTPEHTAPTAAMTAAPVPTMTAAPTATMTAAPVMTAAPSASAAASAAASASPSASASAKASAAVEPPKPPPAVTAAPTATPKATPPATPPATPRPPPLPKKPAGDDPYG